MEKASLSGHIKGYWGNNTLWVDVEKAETPKSLFYSFMLSVTVTSRERLTGSVTEQSLPGFTWNARWQRSAIPRGMEHDHFAFSLS